MRAAFYVRVSTERQQHAQTIEQQVVLLRAYLAERDGWVVREDHIFRDDGYSGAKLERPGLDALRDQAARAAFDVVLITAPDRLARKYVHQMVVLEELERRGVQVMFIDRPPSDDPHEQLVVQIRGAVAEYERVLIADRMRRGRQAKLRAGQLLPWTKPPYAYRLHPDRPRDPSLVEVEPSEAAIVQEIFGTYAAGEVTLHTLALRLTARGVPTPTGRRLWSVSSLRGILLNPSYMGQAASGRLRTQPARQRRSALEPLGQGVSTRVAPPEQWIIVPVPALIAPETFAAVQRRLATNQRFARRNAQRPYLLRGLVSCGVCRLSCTGRAHPGQPAYRYYVCRGKLGRISTGRERRCPARFIPAAPLEALVWTDLCAVLQEPSLIAHELQRAQAGAWVPDEVRRRQATLRGVRASLARQQERLLDAYLATALDLPTFERKRQALRGREEELVARERELTAQSERLVELGGVISSTLQVCEQLRLGFEHATPEEQRHLIELLIDRVVVTDGAVEIRYVIPTTDASTQTRFCHLRTDYFRFAAGDVAVVDGQRRLGAGGHDEAGIGPSGQRLGLEDDAPLAGPAAGLVPDLAGQADLGPAAGAAPGLGFGQQGGGVGLQHGVGDQADGVGDALGLAPGVQARDREAAVGAELDADVGPGGAEPLEQAAQHQHHEAAAVDAAGPQHRRHQLAGVAVEDQQREVHVLAVVAVVAHALLVPVGRVVGPVQVQQHVPGGTGLAAFAHVDAHQGGGQPLDRRPIDRVLQPRERGLAGQVRPALG